MSKTDKDYLESTIEILNKPIIKLIKKFPEFKDEINAKYIEIKKIANNKELEEE